MQRNWVNQSKRQFSDIYWNLPNYTQVNQCLRSTLPADFNNINNMEKRKSNDPRVKSEVIACRVDPAFKLYLLQKADEKDMTLSELVSLLIHQAEDLIAKRDDSALIREELHLSLEEVEQLRQQLEGMINKNQGAKVKEHALNQKCAEQEAQIKQLEAFWESVPSMGRDEDGNRVIIPVAKPKRYAHPMLRYFERKKNAQIF